MSRSDLRGPADAKLEIDIDQSRGLSTYRISEATSGAHLPAEPEAPASRYAQIDLDNNIIFALFAYTYKYAYTQEPNQKKISGFRIWKSFH